MTVTHRCGVRSGHAGATGGAGQAGERNPPLPGVPYGTAGKCIPDRVGMAGDGTMQMGGLAELLTAVKYHKTWAGPWPVFLVLSNEDLHQVTWEQRAMAGGPKSGAAQEIPSAPCHAYAGMIALKGIRAGHPAQIEAAWREAFAAGRPVVIDASTGPEKPPVPPHVSFAQMKAMTKALIGAPEEGLPGAVQAVRELAEEFIPGR